MGGGEEAIGGWVENAMGSGEVENAMGSGAHASWGLRAGGGHGGRGGALAILPQVH